MTTDEHRLTQMNKLPEGWEWKRLGEVCDIQLGKTPYRKDPKFWDKKKKSGNVWLSIADLRHGENISDSTEQITHLATENSVKIPKGTMMVSFKLTLGRVSFAGCDLYTNEAIASLLNLNNIVNKYFLFYYFTFFDWDEASAGDIKVKGKTLNKKKLQELIIPLPPLPEQKRIVAMLDKAFAAIDTAKANAEKNLANAKELFESYLQSVFENLFQEKEKRKISEIAKVIGGYSFKSTDFKKQGKYQVLRMGNVRPAMIRENESPVFIDTTDEKILSKALLQVNDVIITQTGTKNKRDYGFTVIIEKENYLLNQRIASIRFSENYLPKFFLYFSWANIFKEQYFANETGTVGQGNVGIGAITEALVPFVSKTEQQSIVHQLDSLRAETQKLETIYQKKIESLDELKKSILKKAFEGEL